MVSFPVTRRTTTQPYPAPVMPARLGQAFGSVSATGVADGYLSWHVRNTRDNSDYVYTHKPNEWVTDFSISTHGTPRNSEAKHPLSKVPHPMYGHSCPGLSWKRIQRALQVCNSDAID